LGSYFDGSQSGPYFDGSQSGPLAGDPRMSGRVPGAAGGPSFMGLQTSSFTDFLASHSPGLLPGRVVPSVPAEPDPRAPGSGFQAVRDLPHATTIVAAVCHGGVVLAGDRRATAGNMIAKRDVEKVFRSDEFSGMGYAGTGSVGIEFVRLFQVELEHYEKMEGRSLSLEGKANRLAWMVRGNLAAAMQGLVVVPLFVGYDEDTDLGRIFSYDVAGGPYEEQRFYSIGSGSAPAHLPGHRLDHRRRLQEAVGRRRRADRRAGRAGATDPARRPGGGPAEQLASPLRTQPSRSVPK